MEEYSNNEFEIPEYKKQRKGIFYFIKVIFKAFNNHMTSVGESVCSHSRFFSKNILGKISRKIVKAIRLSGLFMNQLVLSILKKPIKCCYEVKEGTLESIEKVSDLIVLRRQYKNEKKLNKKKHSSFRTAINIIMPFAAIAFVAVVVMDGVTTHYALRVEANGQSIGYIAEEEIATRAEEVMQDRIQYVTGDDVIEVKTKLSMTKIQDNNDDVISADELADKLIKSSDVKTVEAYGLYINDKFFGAVKDKLAIENTLKSIMDKYKTDSKDEVVEFVDKYDIKEGLYLENGVISKESIVGMLNGNKKNDKYYTVARGDTLKSIAQKQGVSVTHLNELNPKLGKYLKARDHILLEKAEPFVSVRINRTEEYTQNISYKTNSVKDPSLYYGVKKVLQKGLNGQEKIVAKVSYINGDETKKNIISRDIIKKPIEEKIAIGTKSTDAPTRLISASGEGFMWPVGGSGGYITSFFGETRGRRSYHKGLDIASGGTHLPIYASKAGKVVAATWDKGYGSYILIDHGDGYVTRYAHLSSKSVKYGQTVGKGQKIGIMGSSGNSTGIHLHFEVRVNGAVKNPRNYIKKP